MKPPKKTAKKKSTAKKTHNPAPSPKNTSNEIRKRVIISSLIVSVIIVLGIVSSNFRPSQPAEESVILSEVSGGYITIVDPETNETTEIKILPASASKSTSPPQIKQETSDGYDYLFKKAETKTVIQKINIIEAKKLFDSEKALFIDARSIHSYNSGHIKGAIPIPVNAGPDIFEKYKKEMKNKVLVTYCHGIGCHISDKVAYNLFDRGYRNIVIFFGGWNEWVKSGFPIESSN